MYPIIGIVALGGKSERMGTDKSMLQYHGKAQWLHVFNLLSKLCDTVVVSCNRTQMSNFPKEITVLIDAPEFENYGPIAALLTAAKKYPEASYLLVGCDYPFLMLDDLKLLLHNRNESVNGIAFYNEAAKLYEPLLAIYEQPILYKLSANFETGKVALQHFLSEISALKIIPKNKDTIRSIDTKNDLLSAKEKLEKLNSKN
ncbi:MAG: molybdenum cofactor guanylyltransferase [Bacteroidetes bacterium]|nr:molybdenum cofactor guanylyltransferase [Bacteroidota bacterium]MBK9672083.1 molybdenum cofactor guanylyltransferase [Bacteroidota bacterium]MBK9800644.1 molybdenum cofactor guanylyltransferase [Bacteroidota bacterium]MBP6412008.1 molybdenum cofactor guanylyltransferase [Bacteroidia bacterium]